MDSRLGLDMARYTMDSFGHAPPYNPALSSAPSLPSHPGLTRYLDRDTGLQDRLAHQQGAQYPHLASLSLSTGQGYFTVESLEGRVATQPGDPRGWWPPAGRQDGYKHLGLGQQGFDSSVLGSGLQNGLGQKALPPFGVAAPAHQEGAYLSRELDLGRGRAMGHTDNGLHSYLHEEQLGRLSRGSAYEHPVQPSLLSSPGRGVTGPQEMEFKRRDEMELAAMEQRQTIKYGSQFQGARMHEALIREGQIREAHIREVQIREAQMREARRAFVQERSFERRGRFPLPWQRLGLPMASAPARQGVNKTWCSVCKLECNTSVNLKGHLGGKKHKLKLEEQMKTSENSLDKKGDTGNEDPRIGSESETPNSEDDKAGETQPGHAKNNLNGSGVATGASVLGKRSPADNENKSETLSKKPKQESGAVVSSSEGVPGKTSGRQLVNKKSAEKTILRCETCNVICFNKYDLDWHLGGKRHALKLKQSQQGVGGEIKKANQAGLKPKEVGEAAIPADGPKEGAKNEVGLSDLCAQAEGAGKING